MKKSGPGPGSGGQNVIDETGNQYGKLTVIRHAANRNGRVMWECICNCPDATKCVIGIKLLRNGNTRSCGCLRRRNKPVSARNAVLRLYKIGAKKRGFEWQLTEMEFDELTQGNCFYCDNPPGNINRGGNVNKGYPTVFIYNGIDRIDNDHGYTTGNSVSCCIACNRAKSDRTLAEFHQWIDRLAMKAMSKRTVPEDAVLVDVE